MAAENAAKEKEATPIVLDSLDPIFNGRYGEPFYKLDGGNRLTVPVSLTVISVSISAVPVSVPAVSAAVISSTAVSVSAAENIARIKKAEPAACSGPVCMIYYSKHLIT